MNKYALLIFAILGLISLASIAQQPLDPMGAQAQPEVVGDPMQDPAMDPNAVVPSGAAAPMPQLPPEMSDPLLEGFFEDIGYTPTDKRDPFLPYMSPAQRLTQAPDVPLEPLQRFALAQLKLIGIIWDVGKPKALIEDPGGKSHIILENTKVGQQMGYVAAIREGEIIVVEPLINPEGIKSFQTKVLKLSAVRGGL